MNWQMRVEDVKELLYGFKAEEYVTKIQTELFYFYIIIISSPECKMFMYNTLKMWNVSFHFVVLNLIKTEDRSKYLACSFDLFVGYT